MLFKNSIPSRDEKKPGHRFVSSVSSLGGTDPDSLSSDLVNRDTAEASYEEEVGAITFFLEEFPQPEHGDDPPLGESPYAWPVYLDSEDFAPMVEQDIMESDSFVFPVVEPYSKPLCHERDDDDCTEEDFSFNNYLRTEVNLYEGYFRPCLRFTMPSEEEMAQIVLDQEDIFVDSTGYCFTCANPYLWCEHRAFLNCHVRCGMHGTRVAFLNGANGTFQGDDDIDHEDRQRTRREAQNHLHQRPHNDSNADKAARRVAEHKTRAAKIDVVPTVTLVAEPPPVDPPVTYLVYCPDVPEIYRYGWDGQTVSWYSPEQDSFIAHDGTMLLARQSSVETTLRHGVGWYVLQGDKGRTVVKTSPATYYVDIGEFRLSDGTVHQRKEYLVFAPLLTALKISLPSPNVTPHQTTAAFATAERSFGLLHPHVISETIAYFITLKKKSSTHAGMLTGAAHGSRPLTIEEENPSYVTNLGISVEIDVPFRENAVTCTIPDDYLPRSDCEVTMRGGELDFEKFWTSDDKEDLVYPKFDVGENPETRYYRTCFFRFVGPDVKPFLLYDVNGVNACKAMKRVLGTRDSEDLYTGIQYSLLRGFQLATTPLKDLDLAFNKRLLDVLRVKPLGPHLVQVGTNRHNHVQQLAVPRIELTGDPDEDEMLQLAYDHRKDLFLNKIMKAIKSDDSHLRCAGNSLVDKFDEFSRCYLSNAMTDCNPLTIQNYVNKMSDAGKTLSHWAYYKGFDMYLSHFEVFLSRAENAAIPHVKKALREAYVRGVKLHCTEDVMVERLNGCVKKEWAKFGKVPRLFVSYEAGCMYANELPEYCKVAMDGTRVYRDRMKNGEEFITVVYTCAKMKSDTLSFVFDSIRQSLGLQNYLLVIVYSDDTTYSGCVNGVCFAKNVDISSCDASNKFPIFFGVAKMLAEFNPECALGLVKQCTLPITVRNPSSRDGKVVIQVDSAFEGSGTVLTTILNHFASGLGARFTGFLLSQAGGITRSSHIDKYIVMGSFFGGHKVTIENAGDENGVVLEKVQFLKHSMFQTTNGTWTYAVNYGTVFRSLGTLEGDLTPEQVGFSVAEFNSSSWNTRMDRFCSGVVKGLCNEPSSTILDALRSRFSLDTPLIKEGGGFGPYEVESGSASNDRSNDTICPESLARRYSLQSGDAEELVSMIRGIKIGTIYSSRAVSQFSHLDYGADLEKPVEGLVTPPAHGAWVAAPFLGDNQE